MNRGSPTRPLRAQGHDALAIADPMTAWELVERAERLELLVTCLDFAPGKPNGIALGRIARLKRPGIRVLFVGPADLEMGYWPCHAVPAGAAR